MVVSTGPALSVIIPAYNAAATVGDAIESVLDQNFSDWELIVVDDGSTDGSVELIASIATSEPRVRLDRLPVNSGHGAARNRGIQVARGDYLVFLDADDLLLPGALSEIGRATLRGHDLYLIGSEEVRREIPRSLNPGPILAKLQASPEGWSVQDHPKILFWPPATWSKVYRREFVWEHHLTFPAGYHQDIPWSVEATLKAVSVSGVNYSCYQYRRHGPGSSTTMSKGPKTLERIRQLQRVRHQNSIEKMNPHLQQHLVALAAVHLIWGNRAAYRTMPDHLHEDFFHASSAELHKWFEFARPHNTISSEPLMPTKEREFFTVALLSDNYRLWRHAISTHQKKLRWQRRFDLTRYNLFKK